MAENGTKTQAEAIGEAIAAHVENVTAAAEAHTDAIVETAAQRVEAAEQAAANIADAAMQSQHGTEITRAHGRIDECIDANRLLQEQGNAYETRLAATEMSLSGLRGELTAALALIAPPPVLIPQVSGTEPETPLAVEPTLAPAEEAGLPAVEMPARPKRRWI